MREFLDLAHMRKNVWIVAFVAVASAPAMASANPGEVAVYTEERIFGGEPAEPCAWPTTVLVQNGPGICTGTLVHPQVITYAAHCQASGTTVTFGENAGGVTVPCEFSMTNPGYANVPDDQAHDWAFCVLPEPVDMPVTPVVFGCETSILTPGLEIAIAGFGQTQSMGAGTKHWNMTTLTNFDAAVGTATLGGMGLPSVCPGDSGGPAFVRFPDDGSWHAFGIASTVTGGCGGFGTHASIPHAVPWIEEASGFDITPCHNVDPMAPLLEQEWAPTPQCGNFNAGEPGVGYGTWADGCADTPSIPLSATCGGPFNDGDETPPTVEITSPMDGATFGEELPADSTDGAEDCLEDVDVHVAVMDDSMFIKEVGLRIDCDIEGVCPFMADPLNKEPWIFTGATFPAGQFVLTAIAEDYNGNVAESEPVGIGVCSTAPSVDDDDGETGGSASEEGADKGCGCSSSNDAGWPGMLALFGLAVFVRRRRA